MKITMTITVKDGPPPPDIKPSDNTTGTGEHYVYVHRNTQGRIFYVGKGQRRREWSKDRDDTWKHYVKTRCDGKPTVQINGGQHMY